MNKNILVIGSSNTDLVIQTSHFPEPGETVIGGEFNTFAGGKGANQAVAACRLGGKVTFVAKLGKDGFGQEALNGFKKEGIITTHIYIDTSLPSGVASIILNEKGQNTIVVAPGANNALTEEDIELTKDAISEADIVLIQLEVPLATVIFAIKLAFHLGKRVILNPAPATSLPDEIYPFIDLITPNETEAGILLGMKVIDENSAAIAAEKLLKKGVKNVILTLGEKGAFLKNDEIELLVPAIKTKVRDTTGAGDIFNGALAVSLSEKKDWLEAIQFANRAASIGVSRLGAQASVPYRDEVDRIT
jgi:ribokinase